MGRVASDELRFNVVRRTRGTYQEHDGGLEEQPEVVCFPVRERGFFKHLAISHAGKQSARQPEAVAARGGDPRDIQEEKVEE